MSDETTITQDEQVSANTEPTVNNSVAEVKSEDFLSSLPEDLRSDPSIKDFKSVADLAKSYTHAKSMLGNSIRIPSEDASDEAKAEFYEKLKSVEGVMHYKDNDSLYDFLGRPGTPDEYKLQGEGLDPDLSKEFTKIAHEAGLSQEQVDKIIGFQSDIIGKQTEQLAAKQEDAIKTLQEQWGSDYKNRLEGAKEAARAFSEKYPSLGELVDDPVVGNNAGFIALLSDMAKLVSEGDSPVTLNSGLKYGMSPSDAMEQIGEIRNNPSHPYHNPADPMHDAAKQKMNKLYGIAYPTE